MNIVHEEILIDAGGFSNTLYYTQIKRDIYNAITKVTWPPQSNNFTIYPKLHGNGVVPIKQAFTLHLQAQGWHLEHRLNVENATRPGPIDATFHVAEKYFAVEWETGNISSSHRALNKITIGLLRQKLIGGTLVLPTRKLYRYVTDRIGNYIELEPYFEVWRSINLNDGFLSVIAVEHDEESMEVPLISKGTDGRALL